MQRCPAIVGTAVPAAGCGSSSGSDMATSDVLLGSVSSGLVQNAARPVLVVPGSAAGNPEDG